MENLKRPEWFSEEAAEQAIHDRLKEWLKKHSKPFRVFPGAVMPVRFIRPDIPFLKQPPFEIGVVWVTEDRVRIVETHAEAFYTAKLRGIETIAVFREDQLGRFFDVPFTIQSTVTSDRDENDETGPGRERQEDQGS